MVDYFATVCQAGSAELALAPHQLRFYVAGRDECVRVFYFANPALIRLALE